MNGGIKRGKMRVDILRRIAQNELRSMIRSVPLMNKDPNAEKIYVYKDANINFRTLAPHEVNPTTFYVIRKGLEKQRELRNALLEQGIDTLKLDGALEIQNDEGKICTLTPPIVELTPRLVRFMPSLPEEIKYEESVLTQIPVLNDGAHRVMLARELGLEFNAIYISGAMSEFPFYAHPNEWDRVKVVDDVPSTKKEKKFYSREECYSLYRDFGAIGCGEPRFTKGKNG